MLLLVSYGIQTLFNKGSAAIESDKRHNAAAIYGIDHGLVAMFPERLSTDVGLECRLLSLALSIRFTSLWRASLAQVFRSAKTSLKHTHIGSLSPTPPLQVYNVK